MNETGAKFFVLMAGLAGTMALVYVPLRIFLTATARSRRLRLLQRIRRLRDELGQPLETRIQRKFFVESQLITIPPSTCRTCPVM